jgi:two-component system sensor histidine kinase TctE
MNSRDGYSLKRRLLFRLSPPLLVLVIGLFFLVRSYAERAAERSFDRLLAASALSIADTIQIEDGKITLDLPYSSHAILAGGRQNRVFYRVTAPDGSLVTGYDDLAKALPAANSAEPTFTDQRFLDADVRTVTLGRFVSGSALAGWVTVIVAETKEEQEALSAELLRYSFGPTIGIAALAIGLIWLAVDRSLAPLNEIERAITARQPTDLTPLDAPAPREIRHLVEALNTFMGRLAAILGQMQDFLGEAAHQIRTPLASLRSQVEVVLDEPHPPALREYLKRVHRNAITISHLANQLLADTMIAHRAEVAEFVPVDLLEMCEDVIESQYLDKNTRIQLAIDALRSAPVILGDRVMLAEAIKNIIWNALTYAGRHGPINLAITPSDDRRAVTISVRDQGPGISPDDQLKLTARFVRGKEARDTVGSGLGLAIVSRVVARHGGTLQIANRREGGLRVDLTFHLATAPPVDAMASR